MLTAGSWSVYWYNGLIVSSEIARGLDIFELMPSGLISQNEIDAAKTVRFDYLNAQEQRKLVWPASFALARAYLDQLERDKGLDGRSHHRSARQPDERREAVGAEAQGGADADCERTGEGDRRRSGEDQAALRRRHRPGGD